MDYFLVISFTIFISVAIVFLFAIRSEGTKCYENPIQYGIRNYEKITNTTMLCTCTLLDIKYYPILITSNSTTSQVPENNPINDKWNKSVYYNFTIAR